MKEGKKIYWWKETWLFYKVGYCYSISGEQVILARYWKKRKDSKKKAMILTNYFIDKYGE